MKYFLGKTLIFPQNIFFYQLFAKFQRIRLRSAARVIEILEFCPSLRCVLCALAGSLWQDT